MNTEGTIDDQLRDFLRLSGNGFTNKETKARRFSLILPLFVSSSLCGSFDHISPFDPEVLGSSEEVFVVGEDFAKAVFL